MLMTQKDSTPGQANDGPRTTPETICPRCGEPLYRCGCTDRWENEGGSPHTTPPGHNVDPAANRRSQPRRGASGIDTFLFRKRACRNTGSVTGHRNMVSRSSTGSPQNTDAQWLSMSSKKAT